MEREVIVDGDTTVIRKAPVSSPSAPPPVDPPQDNHTTEPGEPATAEHKE